MTSFIIKTIAPALTFICFEDECLQVLLEDLRKAVQKSSVGAVMVDDSSACDRTEYMSVEIQFMLDGKRHHAFVLLQHVVKADAASLYEKLVTLSSFALWN